MRRAMAHRCQMSPTLFACSLRQRTLSFVDKRRVSESIIRACLSTIRRVSGCVTGLVLIERLFTNSGKFAIVPMGFCFPGYDAHGGDLPPRRECRETWHERVFRSMPQVELILTIGQYAQAYHLGRRRRASMTETVSNWREYFETSNAPSILPLPHPSWRNNVWLKKNPWFAENVLPILREKVRILIS